LKTVKTAGSRISLPRRKTVHLKKIKATWPGLAALAVVLALVLAAAGCKDYLRPDYEVKITIEPGTTGTPVSGTYLYKEFSDLEYDYKPVQTGVQIEVLTNNSRKSTIKGNFTVYCDTEVVVRIIDIRGDWKMAFWLSSSESEEWSWTISGDTPFSGTFIDDRSPNRTGTWTLSGSDLKFTYTNWADYTLSGNVLTMAGSWAGENKTGTWSATKQ